jgi:acyl carrier protein
MNNEIFDKLKEFVIIQSAVNDEEITRETEIENDLGVYGGDADEFLIAFGKKFNVDISQFPIGNYFSGEGDIILPAIIRFFTNTKRKEKKSFTVGHLEKAIISGKLDADTMLE